jgi:hypothetical protein
MQSRIAIELLEDRLVPTFVEGTQFITVSLPRLVVGAGVGGGEVRAFNASPTGDANATDQFLSLTPFGADFTGGVNVATVDLNGDTIPDIIAGMASGGSVVKVFDGKTGAEILGFTAFEPEFTGGVNVAVGRVAANGWWGIVVGVAGQGGPHVAVFDAITGKAEQSFFAFEPEFTGGVTVAAGDVTHDGTADVVIGAGSGGGPRVEVFDGTTHDVVRNFFAYDSVFTGGVNVAVTSLYQPADIVVSSDSPGQEIKYIGPDSLLDSASAPFVGTGARIAVANFRGEGSGIDTLTFPDVVTGAGPGGGPRIKDAAFLTNWSVGSFFAFDSHFTGGVSIAAASSVIDAVVAVLDPPPPPTPSGSGGNDPTQTPGGTT